MSEFDRYLERLHERAGLHLGLDEERELRAHFEEAVAAERRAGHSLREAELVALDELGKPEVIAAAFRAERRALRRFAGGPGVLVADLARQARLYLAVVALTAGLGALAGRAAPPTYTIRVPLAVLVKMDFGNEIAARTALDQVRFPASLPVHLRWTRGPVLEVSSSDQAVAVTVAQQATDEATSQFPLYFQRTLYGRGDTSAVLLPGMPRLATTHPVTGDAAAGAGLGAAGIAIRALFRRRGRR